MVFDFKLIKLLKADSLRFDPIIIDFIFNCNLKEVLKVSLIMKPLILNYCFFILFTLMEVIDIECDLNSNFHLAILLIGHLFFLLQHLRNLDLLIKTCKMAICYF